MKHQETKQTLAYIIDSDFKIICSNSEFKRIVPDAQLDRYCYEIFGNEHSQCKKCPLRGEHEGSSILFDHLRGEWISVSSAPIDVPRIGTCHVIINDPIEGSNSSHLYDAVEKSEYAELLELDYQNDCFRVAYHGERKKAQSPITGQITAMVRQLADHTIHPDDRQRFFDFWLLDRIGSGELPQQLFTPRHGEFRKRQSDDSYVWVQQVMLPIRQSSPSEIFVNNFFNIIDMPTVPFKKEHPGDALLGRDAFFRRADRVLARGGEEARWSLIAIDVERLKLFNEWYGRKAGDLLLDRLSQCLLEFQNGRDRLAGHFYDDDYAVLMPYDEEAIQQLYQAVCGQIKLSSDKMNILPAFGVYTVTGSGEPVYSMYDRAKLACSSIKGNFSQRIRNFDRAMLEKLQAEYLLLSDIQKAFQNHEFTFYLQPKCNTESGKIAGAEALARWESPEKGMISPGIFVPFLEKSGLISELDTYIWEEVCAWQRSVLDRGLRPIPVSVNVSRIDIYAVDVPTYFQNLIQKYDLDPSLIEIEITESAYAQDTALIVQVVRSLRNAGFCVLIDDFGSAYSSLNMLKDIEVDVLKIDMRFLDSPSNRGANIVETVCHMAHLLGLKIVAEGVETEPQREMLMKAGCTHSQGYYFYKPMSITDFESTVADPEKLDSREQSAHQDVLFQLKDLMLQNAFDLNMLDNLVGALAFYDVCGEDISVLRYNEQYAALFSSGSMSTEMSLQFGKQLYQEEFKQIFWMFDSARANPNIGSELDLRRRRPDGSDIWVNMRVFFLYQRGDHSVFYSTVRDVTPIHQSNEELKFLNNDMPGGYYRHLGDEMCTFTHISQRFLDIFGYSRQEIRELFNDQLLSMVHPEDWDAVRNSTAAMARNGGNYTQPCRMMSKNGYIYVLDQSRLVEYNGEKVVQGIILCDFDPYMWLSESTNANDNNTITTLMPCGFFQSEVDGNHSFSFVSNSMLQMLGYDRAGFHEKFQDCTENLVYSKDLDHLTAEILHQIQQSNFVSCEYRIEAADGSLKWVYSRARMSTDRNGKRWFNTVIIDHDYLREKYEVHRWQYLKYKSLTSIPGVIVFDYDPFTDSLTIEMADKNGHIEQSVADHYLERIEEWGVVSKEHASEQKRILTQASRQACTGISEFRGRFQQDTSYRWFRFRYSSLADETGRVYRVIGRGTDISNEKMTISSLTHRATKDSLTGLLNYESAKSKAEEQMRKTSGGMLFLLDIDNFKEINDTYGHLVGDKLLKTLAAIIHNTFRKEGISGRFGGDEFLVFLPNLNDQYQAEALIHSLQKAIARVQISQHRWLECSIGIAPRLSSNVQFDTLFQQADTAMYHAKRSGKNRYSFYTDDIHELLLP